MTTNYTAKEIEERFNRLNYSQKSRFLKSLMGVDDVKLRTMALHDEGTLEIAKEAYGVCLKIFPDIWSEEVQREHCNRLERRLGILTGEGVKFSRETDYNKP